MGFMNVDLENSNRIQIRTLNSNLSKFNFEFEFKLYRLMSLLRENLAVLVYCSEGIDHLRKDNYKNFN